MPRTAGVSVPKYRYHKASDQAVVTIQAKDHYLGPWKSKASRVEYDRLIGEWLAAGRPSTAAPPANELTIGELIAKYWLFAEAYYVKNGEPTGSTEGIRVALRILRQTYGHTVILPDCGMAVQNSIARRGLRRTIVDCDVLAGDPRFYLGCRDEEPPFPRAAEIPNSRVASGISWFCREYKIGAIHVMFAAPEVAPRIRSYSDQE